jgi:hypothetical protein
MEQVIESALAPGRFISYNANHEFVGDLEAAEKRIASLVPTEPKIAVSLYETFLADCNEKAEEIDDSSGSLGQFVDELFCGWIKARQAAGADPDETATRLLAWMDDDPYGFCHELEKDAAKVFNKAGLAAFERQVRARFDAAATLTPDPGESFRRNPDYQRRRCGEMLRTIYLAQKNVDAYVALSEATGLTAKDCHALATMLGWGASRRRRSPGSSAACHDLAHLKRDLLTKLGRGNEALDAAWAEFRAHPSKYSYEDLMKYVPKAERRSWHDKAIEAAKGTDLQALIELLLETKEIERLAVLVGQSKDSALEDVSSPNSSEDYIWQDVWPALLGPRAPAPAGASLDGTLSF